MFNFIHLLVLILAFNSKISFSRIVLETEIPSTTNLLVTRLIHDNSVDSPNYNPNATIEELANIDFATSQARAFFVKEGSSYLPDDLETTIYPAPKTGGFYAIIQVGSERTIQRVYVDTGSSLSWINCWPCTLDVPEEIFDPAKSNSYEPESCITSQYCNIDSVGLLKFSCDSRQNKYRCKYEYRYLGGSKTTGHLARDNIKFFNSEEVLQKFVFGCSKTTTLFTNGVLGIGHNNISLVKQSGYSKLSYCIGDLTDLDYEFNRLIIGDRIELRGDQTPMISENHHFINLEKIKIGGEVLEIDMYMFRRWPGHFIGGVVLDTGTTYTYFPEEELKRFEMAIIDAMDISDDWEETDPKLRVCYRGNMNSDLKLFPMVEFVFQDNAVMKLTIGNLFRQINDNKYCLAFLSSNEIGLEHAVLGSWTQQQYYIAMDIKIGKLAFQKMDCSTIDDKIIHDEL